MAIIYLTDCYFNVWLYLHHTANRLSAAVRVKNHCEPVLFSPFQSTFPKTPRSYIHLVLFSPLFPIPVWVKTWVRLNLCLKYLHYRQSAGYRIGNRQLIRQGNKLKPFPKCAVTLDPSQELIRYKQGIGPIFFYSSASSVVRRMPSLVPSIMPDFS